MVRRAIGVLLLWVCAAAPAAARYDQVWLAAGPVRALVSARYPLVLRYERTGVAAFDGAAPDARWSATVIRPDRAQVSAPVEELAPPSLTRVRARYRLGCVDRGKVVVRFAASITVRVDQVVYQIGAVECAPGYLLRQIDFGRAIQVALPRSAGSATVCGGTLGRDPGAYFLRSAADLPTVERALDMVMLCQRGCAAVGYNNLVIHPWRFARQRQSEATAFWCPPYTKTVVAGAGSTYTTAPMPGFLCRIGLLGDRNADGQVDWQDGAAFIHDSLPGGVPLFQEYTRYEAGDDFDAFRDVVRRLYYITDGRPQLCLHAAWQYWGWDSEYPAYMQPNDELGGREALYRLMREAPKYRCVVSLIHNFDDSYKASPAWNESIVMRRSDQSLVEATAWAGGRSYINGPWKMVRLGWAKRVIDGLTAQGARVRIFSDVLSAVPERVDEDRQMPSDALANLVLGKFRILDMLRARGIIVGSESVTWPFVGRICTAHSMPLGISERPEEVPLGPFVLHGKMAYQAWSSGPDTLLAGVDDTTGWDNDRIYLWSMVLEQYAHKPMTRYTRRNGLFRTEFGRGTYVEWRRGWPGARVVVDGRLIANGESSFIPKRTPNVFLAYSRSATPQRYPRPKGWTDPTRLLAYRLSDGPQERVDSRSVVRFDGGDLVLTLQPHTPYRICYGRAAYLADKKLRETPFPQPCITWPVEKVLSSAPAGGRPPWVRRSTRVNPPGAALYVGCGAAFPTLEQSREHAASIVARKVAWEVRQKYVSRSREYERQTGIDGARMGFDNWNLGVDEPLTIYSLARISSMPGVRWYVERILDRNPQWPAPRVMYRAFVAVPVTESDLHNVYVTAIRNNLESARSDLAGGKGNRSQLEARIKLWSLMLDQESRQAS